MGYLHISNLYADQDILLFKQAFALEKINGTSAHVSWKKGQLGFFHGGANGDAFIGLFNQQELTARFKELFSEDEVVVYGEAYGGKIQAMSKIYGKELRFIVFDVQVNSTWLSVPNADDVAKKMGLEFVDYKLVPTDLDSLNSERDKDSAQAMRNLGVMSGAGKMREGIVLRPVIELTKSNGARIICKHKRAEFSERKSNPDIDPSKQQVISEANAIAEEWVTPMRLSHVLDHLGNPSSFKDIPKVIDAMIEDVVREAKGEIVDSRESRKAIGAKAVSLYKNRLQTMRA